MSFGDRFIDVTDPHRTHYITPGPVERDIPLVPPDIANIKNLREALRQLAAIDDPTHPQGILYFSQPGRYLIENDRPHEWLVNLWEAYLGRPSDSDTIANWVVARDRNPFGASLRIPPDVTLWLAPGAVLVPAEGAIVHIEGPLVCGATQVFDLSLGGLVVFGKRVPKLLPQWWGVHSGEDHADALQAAIDAGINNRSNIWEQPYPSAGFIYTVTTVVLPLIPIELRGDYTLRKTVTIRGEATQNQILEKLGLVTVGRGARTVAPREVALAPTINPMVPQRITLPASPTEPSVRIVNVTVAPTGFVTATLESDGYELVITSGAREAEGTVSLVLFPEAYETITVHVTNSSRVSRELPAIVPNGVVAGAWHGRRVRGARFVAEGCGSRFGFRNRRDCRQFVGELLTNEVPTGGGLLVLGKCEQPESQETPSPWNHASRCPSIDSLRPVGNSSSW